MVVILLGSQARGDARPDSDLLVLLNKPAEQVIQAIEKLISTQ